MCGLGAWTHGGAVLCVWAMKGRFLLALFEQSMGLASWRFRLDRIVFATKVGNTWLACLHLETAPRSRYQLRGSDVREATGPNAHSRALGAQSFRRVVGRPAVLLPSPCRSTSFGVRSRLEMVLPTRLSDAGSFCAMA